MSRVLYVISICLFVFGCGQKKNSSIELKSAVEKDIAFFKAESIEIANDTAMIKRFVMLIAPRAFRDEEFRVPYELLTKIGHKIYVASRDTVIAVGISGLALKPQFSIKDIDTLKYDGLILIGGTGAAIYWDDLTAHRLVQYFTRTPNKIIAAICIAPVTLARAGVLAGIKATVFEDKATITDLKNKGALYEKADVVVSGNIITASGPAASIEFAKAIALSVK